MDKVTASSFRDRAPAQSGAPISKDLLEPSQVELRKLFRRTGVRADLRRLAVVHAVTQCTLDFPAEALLAHNLKCPDYVDIVCGSLARLDQAFAELGHENRNGN